jgi:murein DD-endopeptidase MepM/ murein hydrolase activator NlpD
MRRHAVTGRRVRDAALLVVLVTLLGTGPASAMPLVDAPPATAAGIPAYDVRAHVSASAPFSSGPPYAGVDRHDEADVAARGSGAVPEWMAPVGQYVTTAVFGQRGGSWTTRHTGLDLKAPRGTPVYAVHDGTVVKLAWHKAYGRMVILEVSPGVTVWYCHLSAVTVEPGPVHVGQQLGRIGATGNASGPHLHLEVRVHDRPTDPTAYLFGDPPGVPTAPPSWLPPVPIVTVANLATLTRRH